MKILLRRTLSVLLTLNVTIILGVVILLCVMRVNHIQLLTVQSASMQPTLQRGDAVIVEPKSLQQLEVGEIVSYHHIHDRGVIVSHRVTKINATKQTVTTFGDATRSIDTPTPNRLIIGRVAAVAPNLGYVIDFIRKPLGMILLIYVPAITVLCKEIYRVTRHIRAPDYRLLPSR